MATDNKFRFTFFATDRCFRIINEKIITAPNFFKAVDKFKDYLKDGYPGCMISNIEVKEVTDGNQN